MGRISVFPCEVSFPGNAALSLRLRSVMPNINPKASSSLPPWCSFWNVWVVLVNEMQDGLSALWHHG